MSDKPLILVIDDDQPILGLMHSLLKEFGFESSLASNGEQALAAARARKPDLVLLDKNLPGMDGTEIIRRLRDEPDLGQTPILILSGEPLSSDDVSALGVAGAVLKPFDIPELLAEIHGQLRGR